MTKTITLGINRGKPRLWLEGAILTDAGFTRGLRFNITTHTDKTLRLTLAPDGKRKVSGKTKHDGTDHPIIDLNGDFLSAFGSDRAITLSTAQGVITLRGK